MITTPKNVVVVGAGITGLTTAYALLRDGPSTNVVVLDGADRVGGKIATGDFAGRPVDSAADAFLARVPDAVDLCHELGLAEELVAPAARTAYVFTRGRLQRLPEGLVLGVPTDLAALARSDIVSAEAVARAERDLAMAEPAHAGPGSEDESVGSLVRRRVGDEVFETLVAPLLSGVYAGDADQLSAAVATPQFVTALRDHGSLITGLRAQVASAASDAPVFYGLRTGTQTLVDSLATEIERREGRIELSRAVRRIELGRAVRRTELGPQGLRVVDDEGNAVDADAVVLTTPDFVTSSIVADLSPGVAAELAALEYASVVLVSLAVPADAFDGPLEGTGFLVPEREGLLLTACSWASTKWAHLAGDPVILRASAGRSRDERALALDDDELVAELVADLRRTMGLRGEPGMWRVSRWPHALPQFAPGHLARVERWRQQLRHDAHGLELAGAGVEGLGIPACIRQARRAAAAVLAALGRPPR